MQVEEDLRRALIMSVIGREAAGSAAEVSDALALRFALNADALDLKRVVSLTLIRRDYYPLGYCSIYIGRQ